MYELVYDASGETTGPLRSAHRPPPVTPSSLKSHLDAFVVGQDRAKRVLATAVYNHYQRVNELQRRDEEAEELLAQEERRRMAAMPRHPVEGREHSSEYGRAGIRVPALTKDFGAGEDEFPGQVQTTGVSGPGGERGWTLGKQHGPHRRGGEGQQQGGLYDPTPLTVEKSNILLLGPSGVGKTLMAKTLARVLEVPFSMSDCTPFTQAGYIGEDAEVCVQRLLAAANYDVARAERGIICLDEIDKIATARVSHGKDVSGEGVQQALLKIIEGTTLQIQAKSERGSGPSASSSRGAQQGFPPSGSPTNSPLSTGGGNPQSVSGGQKGETYNVKTDNILFICAGAFNGLHKMILDRISKGSIGFNAVVRAAPGTSSSSSSSDTTLHETILEGEDELFAQHLPYFIPPTQTHSGSGSQKKRVYNTLDLLQPPDLQKFGLIPELIGRLPISCALSALSTDALVQVLTEPRNSLLKQYQHLFSLSAMDLRFTTPALHAVARIAASMGTGARGLRTVMERVLGESMFEGPGSGVRFVVVTEAAAEGKEGVRYFLRGEGEGVRSLVEEEEARWEEKMRRERGEEGDLMERRAAAAREGGAAKSFEEYREKVGAAGF